jgi:DNA-binding MarR family transcriptional regulator
MTMAELNAEHQLLALRMVQVLPGFGAWASSIRNFETPFGRIGLRQLSILYIMRYPSMSGENPTPSDLAQKFDVQPSVITRCLARLEQQAFMARVQDSHDRRIARLSITEKGREVSVWVEELFVSEMRRSTAFLGPDQVTELSRWIEVLSDIRDDLMTRKNLGTSVLAASASDDTSEDE